MMGDIVNLHSPKNLVTEDYNYIAAIDTHPDPEDSYANDGWADGLTESQINGVELVLDNWTGSCAHCGARPRYVAIMFHKPSNDYLVIGFTCLENRFQRATRDFQTLREHAELVRQSHRIRAAIAEFVTKFPDLAVLDTKELPEDLAWNHILTDMTFSLRKYGSLTEKQVVLARKIIAEAPAQHAEHIRREAARAAEHEAAAPVPTGRIQITGTVVTLREPDPNADFPSWKMLVRDDSGFKVWGTRPSSLWDVNIGQRVRFVATVEPSKKDDKFGFYSRPTKAEVVEAQS